MRVIRLVVYDGPDQWVQTTLGSSLPPGRKVVGTGNQTITIIPVWGGWWQRVRQLCRAFFSQEHSTAAMTMVPDDNDAEVIIASV